MLIDWFTVAAQAFNFLILVWLLKRFLYKPILDAIDAREKRIAGELAEADAKKAEARKERDEFRRKNEEFDQQRAALLKQAADEAAAERRRLLDQARKESDTMRTRWQEALRKEHQSLSEELSRRTQEEVFAIARRTLTDLATTSLEEQMTDVFIRRLGELSPAEKRGLKATFENASTPAIVRSTFDLPDGQRRAIEEAIKTVLAMKVQVRFETAPELVSGIDLTANGHKVAWSIGNYLASLKQRVNDLLKERPKTDSQAHIQPHSHSDEQQT